MVRFDGILIEVTEWSGLTVVILIIKKKYFKHFMFELINYYWILIFE